MIRTGMVSVTFRKMTPREVVDVVAEAGLEGIEWGGDVHVPPGDLALAREVGQMSRDAGLATPSYGSYFRLVENDVEAFGPVVETAQALGASNIRVWAGKLGSEQADAAYHEGVRRDSKRIAEMAQAAGLTVSYEYHANTVADTPEATLDLVRAVDAANVFTYWQMEIGRSDEGNLAALQALLPHLSHVHVFYWVGRDRRLLEEGTAQWQTYFDLLRGTGKEHWAFLEFVREEDVNNFKRDARTLRQLAKGE